MPWRCFPGQNVHSNRSNPCSSTHLSGDYTDAQPSKTNILSTPRIQVQEPAAAYAHGNSDTYPAPFEIVQITGARPPYSGQRSQQEKTEFTALGICRGGTITKTLNYEQVQSQVGGPEALDRFLNDSDAPLSFNTTPSLPSPLPTEPEGQESTWMEWLRWVLGGKRRPATYEQKW
ncbi:uncharacterized protein BDV14DRAFT_33274 [Aspergillus stella-maris]|uniref:uncharacterized protein n=1 Tax=Aspergillus stella-maris TaxID=1810926 RepID=UPI003CCD4989